MPDSTRGLAAEETSGTASCGDVVALGMAGIVSGTPGLRPGRAGQTACPCRRPLAGCLHARTTHPHRRRRHPACPSRRRRGRGAWSRARTPPASAGRPFPRRTPARTRSTSSARSCPAGGRPVAGASRSRRRAGTPAPSSCATTAEAGPRSRSGRTRGPAAPASWSARAGSCSAGGSPSRACGPSSGTPTSATGRRAGSPGGSASPSTAASCAASCATVMGRSSTRGRAPCSRPTTPAPAAVWLESPELTDGVRPAPGRPARRHRPGRGGGRRRPHPALARPDAEPLHVGRGGAVAPAGHRGGGHRVHRHVGRDRPGRRAGGRGQPLRHRAGELRRGRLLGSPRRPRPRAHDPGGRPGAAPRLRGLRPRAHPGSRRARQRRVAARARGLRPARGRHRADWARSCVRRAASTP